MKNLMHNNGSVRPFTPHDAPQLFLQREHLPDLSCVFSRITPPTLFHVSVERRKLATDHEERGGLKHGIVNGKEFHFTIREESSNEDPKLRGVSDP